MSSMDPVGVIGGGLGGLAAACTLAARGHKVILFEKNDWLGGKAAVLEEEGFRFDMGPTILTVPAVLRRIFAEAGRDLDAAMDLRRLDPQWRCFFDDGSVLDLTENTEAMAGNLDAYSPGNSAGYRDFLKMSEGLHEVSERFFFWQSVEDIRDTMDFKKGMDLATLQDVLSLKMGSTVAKQIRKRVPDARVAQMLDHFVQYVGSSPYNSPAVLCSIAHMQTDGGVWYPMGGTRAVPLALAKLADELGVDIAAVHGHPAHRVRPGRGQRGRDRGRRDGAAVRRGVQHGRRAHLPRAGRRQARGELRQALEARAGVLRRGAVSRAGPRLRPSGCTTTSSSPATRRRSSTGSTTRASRRRTRPATSPRPPAPSPAWRRRAARRCTCWCTRRTCGRTTTGRRCCRTTAR